MNQLISRTDAVNEETYTYDKRGNIRLIMKNGVLENQYTYGALNRLEQAVNGKGEAALYTYNGLGHRVGKTTGSMEMAVSDPLRMLDVQDIRPEKEIEYTIDLTRQYHNLLQKNEGGNTQSYLWDVNVAGVAEDGNERYYFQDELGSPIRLMDKDGEAEESYGYDEFGQDLYGNQGKVQPFGYTGYQADRLTGTYYAQAREYKADLGRFAAVDRIKGFATAPFTLNEYGYCWGNPMILVDLNGAQPDWPDWIVDLGEDIENAGEQFVTGAIHVVNAVAEFRTDVINAGAEFRTDVINAGAEFTTDVINAGAEFTTDVINAGAQFVTNEINAGAQFVTNAINPGSQLATGAINVINEGAQIATDRINEGAQNATNVINEGAQNATDRINEGAQIATDRINTGARIATIAIITGSIIAIAEQIEIREFINNAQHIGEEIANWKDNYVGYTYVTEDRRNANGGAYGTYTIESDTVSDNKFINITIKNGVFQSASLNFNWQLGNISSNSSIGFSFFGMVSTASVSLENNGNTYTYSTSNEVGPVRVATELGCGSNGTVEGGGFRFSYNPLESYDFYGFVDTPNGVGTHRTEGGIYVNSGIVESVAVIAIAGYYIIPQHAGVILQLINKIPPLKAIETFIQELLRFGKTLGLFYLLNGEINKNSCDSEGT